MKNILLISTLLLFNCCSSQSKTELSDLKPGANHEAVLKNATRQTDLEQTTGYPYYNTYKVDQYQYGGIQFVVDYPKEKKFLKSEIGFLVNNQKDNLLQGYFIVTKNFKESESLVAALKKKYGEPEVISTATDAWPYSGYYWKKTKDGFDILLEQVKSKVTTDQKEAIGFETSLYFVKSGIHYGNMEDRETVLQSFITTHEK
ncbi:hypothetical protein H3Z85_02085 [Chryseobacterium indologenes]|uniref:hypothetical protein n=1 Tax=Chryseobacterium indologenes TaxID=253 RepID=UPI0008ECDA80|nr:hypothetical protein [Chryseobacterium indologenes]QPQ52316.1 hypothetical protein H3Z85_02085 [Chryseobacterium indologenes]SFJ89130.1 hypothetical protein SAMN05421692_2862 [Chryseobacterium indologenes]SUX50934.1 Uncharacterised protein [Chryseobacterium indologenes]